LTGSGIIGLAAGFRIAAEEGPDVPLETDRQRGHRRPAPEPAQGEVDDQILGAAPGDGVPLVDVSHARDQDEGLPERARVSFCLLVCSTEG
jgi:hypothetical protein